MIERRITIGCIVSTEYLQQIKHTWDPQYIESTTAKKILLWVWEYFDKYGVAPNKQIEDIYYTKLKQGKLPKDLSAEIEEDILPSLSEEYEREDFNLKFLLDETEGYFNKRHLQLHNETVESLLTAGETKEAEQLIREFKPLDNTSDKLDDFILTVGEIAKKERPRPVVLIKSWLKQGQITVIYGNYGTGKSLLTMHIAYILGLQKYDEEEAEIGEWQVKNPTGCLYIDGELGELAMEERINGFKWIGYQHAKHRIRVLSVPEYQLETEDTFYLSDRGNQLKIVRWLKDHPNYKLLVLDSASTLFGLVDENSNSEWNNKVNPFLRDLRALDVACLLLHHAGKDGRKGFRGASAIGAMTENIFRLSNHDKQSIDAGEAWFVLHKDKQRAGGFSFKTFALHYHQNDGKSETHWELTPISFSDED